ncbi:MAG: SPFH domain-containing protein [Chloroflexota bacterium]
MAHVYHVTNQTAEQRFRERLLFEAFVPPHQLAVVFRGQNFSRFIEPGKHNWRPFPGVETIIGYLDLSTVYLPFQLKQVLSTDGFPFQVSGTIAYIYDPRDCPNLKANIEYLMQAVRRKKSIEEPILTVLNKHLRVVAGSIPALELMNGNAATKISCKLAHTVNRQLNEIGVRINQNFGIVIEQIIAPELLQNAQQRGLSHWLEYVSGLTELSDSDRNKLIQMKLADNGNLTLFVDSQSNKNGRLIHPGLLPQLN